MWETVIVNPFTNVLLMIYKLIGGNFGVAIILFTVLIRLLTHPLMASQIKGSTKMQELQNSKEWLDLQKKYKDDKEKLAQEQMKYYQSIGYNPLASCLPTFIQLPIMFGLYQSIMRAIAASPMQLLILSRAVYPFFRLADVVPLNSQFLWMNLGQPERVYLFGYGIPVMAILVAATTYIQSKVTLPVSANPNDQSAMMGNMMAIYMPLFMGFLTYSFASGLALYIIIGNLLSLVQYALLGKIYWKNLLPGKRPVPVQAGGKKK
ncbi:MAG TPA: YidC/Oxa1 family membrane protein insertase [Anaerolineales bacterium]|nr:YidC/Oxa1 family membrane protein insertase [Anaerolineales bacterium]